jgi:hypothetical protein
MSQEGGTHADAARVSALDATKTFSRSGKMQTPMFHRERSQSRVRKTTVAGDSPGCWLGPAIAAANSDSLPTSDTRVHSSLAELQSSSPSASPAKGAHIASGC